LEIVNMDEAKTHLSRLVDKAVNGESFVIAKSGTPLVKVTAIDTPKSVTRLGFMSGEIVIPSDFDRMGDKQIERLFNGNE
jgi:prevent-host-death family protein